MINPVLVRLEGGMHGGMEGVTEGGSLNIAVTKARDGLSCFCVSLKPPFFSPSAFCFSCQENWQAVGMKKADQVEQAPNLEAMLRL